MAKPEEDDIRQSPSKLEQKAALRTHDICFLQQNAMRPNKVARQEFLLQVVGFSAAEARVRTQAQPGSSRV
jgi:hypothetical protein